MSLESLFALPSTARVTTFFLSPCFYQAAPLGARWLLWVFSPSRVSRRTPATLGGFGSHSLEIFLSTLLSEDSSGWPASAASSPVSQAFCRRAFHPVAVLACREIYQTLLFCQFFSCPFSAGLLPQFRTLIHNFPNINKIRFCHTANPFRHFFEHSSSLLPSSSLSKVLFHSFCTGRSREARRGRGRKDGAWLRPSAQLLFSAPPCKGREAFVPRRIRLSAVCNDPASNS